MPDDAMPVLHGYFRSGAAYRVRIALNYKGIAYADRFHHLRRGEQCAPAYLALNPQGLLPTLCIDGLTLTQSLAICDYLEETRPHPPLLPRSPEMRAKVRAFALAIAADTHPVQNLKILNRLASLGVGEEGVQGWAARTITEGLDACEALVAPFFGPYCFGDEVTLADVCLIPQLVNARRFGATVDAWPRLLAAERACLALEPFCRATPENQPDRE